MASVSSGLMRLRPRWRKRRKETDPSGLSPQGRQIRFWLLVFLSCASTAYFVWERRTGVTPTTPVSAPAAAHAPAKAETPLPLPLPGGAAESRDLLARAQLENELLYTDLQSFVCNEHIDRFKGSVDGDKAHQVDTVTSKVSFENGVEHYSDILQNNHQRPALSSVQGAWSEGEFGTLLRQTRALLGTQTALLKEETNLEGTPAGVYTIQTAEADSPWNLVISSHEYRIPFQTLVWVAKDSGRILKIERTSTQMAPATGIAQLRWGVTLQPVQLENKTWLLPKTGEYEVAYAKLNRKEWNVMNFSDYRRYGARTVLHF